jgi:3-isopropylmalate/(R)-2-methylmalate dehydratase large subunit
MSAPLVKRIIATHSGRGGVRPGEIVTAAVDRVYVQDGNSPTIARIFEKYGFTRVFDPARIGVFFDHSVLPPNVEMADRLREAEAFCERFGLQLFRAGSGISHVVAQEEGWYQPGTIVLGSDSHTCTGGVLQCLALGMGASDVAAAMVTGETWLRVPESVRIEVRGVPGPHAGAKDVLLHLLATWGQDAFLYRSVEWTGAWVAGLSSDSAATVANMAVEMGAKCTFLPPGAGRQEGLVALDTDRDRLALSIELDVEGLPPFIARPHAPSNAVPVSECAGQRVDMIFVGSCTNSRIEDIAVVARVLDGQAVRSGVSLVVTPGSRQVFLEALRLGYIETITRAGGLVTPPGCGSCLGTQGPVPASGDRVLTTMNRNFLGRMGNPRSEIYLSSPVVAAHAAILGHVPSAGELT